MVKHSIIEKIKLLNDKDALSKGIFVSDGTSPDSGVYIENWGGPGEGHVGDRSDTPYIYAEMKNGKKHGEYIRYDINGNVAFKAMFENDVMIEDESYDADSKPQIIKGSSSGERELPPNAKIKAAIEYRNTFCF